jgi:indole-3-glycerol phosphate synthase
MSRELVTAEQIKPPKELQVFFDDPPLVGNERREDYENFFRTIAAAVKPADAILWVLVRDFADITWEIRRERKIKADIIKLKQKEVLVESSFRMTRDDYLREHALAKGEAPFISEFKKKAQVKPEVKEEDNAELLAQAYMHGNRCIDIIDVRIASYEYRRIATLKVIASYSEALARKADKASRDVIDGEFTEAAE